MTAGLGLVTVAQVFPEPQRGAGLWNRKMVSALRVLSTFWEDGWHRSLVGLEPGSKSIRLETAECHELSFGECYRLGFNC